MANILITAAFVIFMIALLVAFSFIFLGQEPSLLGVGKGIQPDVLVVHSNGIMIGYNASVYGSPGIALVAASANAVNGDTMYLKAETYNIGTNSIDLSIGTSAMNSISQKEFSVYGAGKYQTKILQHGSGGTAIKPSSNSVIADLSIISNSSGAYGSGLDINLTRGTIVRNVYMYSWAETVELATGTYVINSIFYNVTINNHEDGIFYDSIPPGTLWVFDSNIIESAGGNGISLNGNTSAVKGLFSDGVAFSYNTFGTVNLVNTKISFVDPNSLLTSGVMGVYEILGSTTNIYGGSYASPPAGDSGYNLYAPIGDYGIININSTVSYNPAYAGGTISNLGADVAIFHSNGITIGYSAPASTDNGRGIALMEAMTNAISGDLVFLKAENYNIGSNGITIPANVYVYGAGKFKTNIISTHTFGFIVLTSTNTSLGDLSVIDADTSGLPGQPIGSNLAAGASNVVIRNVNVSGRQDGLYFVVSAGYASPQGNIIVQNVTCNSNWDCNNYQFNGIVTIEDSTFDGNAISSVNSQHQARGLAIEAGTANVINSAFTGTNGITDSTGIEVKQNLGLAPAILSMYGGYAKGIGVSGTSNDLNNLHAGTLAINQTVRYSTTNGVITSLGSTSYGPYSYQTGPVSPPQNVINVLYAPYPTYTYQRSPMQSPWTGGPGTPPAVPQSFTILENSLANSVPEWGVACLVIAICVFGYLVWGLLRGPPPIENKL